MTYQAPQFLLQQHHHSQYRRTFFQRSGHHGIWVLPDEVLNATPLPDETSPEKTLPSLRALLSRDGLCYAQVEEEVAQGFYKARVAATSDLADAKDIFLTEEDLLFARPWDVRLAEKSPDCIRRLLFACAQELRPLQAHARSISTDDLLPAPIIPLVAAETVEISTADLQEALTSEAQNSSLDLALPPAPKPVRNFAFQQALLRVVLRKLQQQVARARSVMVVQSLQARCALLERLQRWHQQTRQRVVNAARGWSGAQKSVVWSLTVGMPASLLDAAPATSTC